MVIAFLDISTNRRTPRSQSVGIARISTD